MDEPRGAGEEPEYEPNPGWRWAGGDDPSTGRLWGGCRALVEWQLTIDRYLPDPDDLDGAVLALATADDLPGPEDVAATLVCLGERGLLEGFSAVLVGRPPGRSYLREPPRERRKAYRERLSGWIVSEVERYDPTAPVVPGLDGGHTTPIAPLPIGERVRIDPGDGAIVFE